MSFDRIAASYRFLEWIAFFNLLQRARTAFIPQVVESRRALVVGEGDGRFLAELLRTHPEAEIDCIDASAAMIQCARARMAAVIRSRARGDSSSQFDEPSCVKFHHADFLQWTPQQQAYDLVVTHFFLDCFNRERLPHVIAKLAHVAAPRSRWLIADFAVPPKGLRRVHAKIWLRVMYSFFRAAADLEAHELVDPSSFIRDTGFQLRQEIVTCLGLVKTQLWERVA